MVIHISRSLLIFLRFCTGFSPFLCLILCSLAEGENKTHLHIVEVKSLLPAATCIPSTKGDEGKESSSSSVIIVVHKHGPCSRINKKSSSSSGTESSSTGTVITRLPAMVYTVLRDAFRQWMKSYTSAPALSILDTCYDFSNVETVMYPKIAFAFDGGMTLDLDATGILYWASVDQVCLAFAGNSDNYDLGIFGNVQQKRLQVVYDVGGRKIGFAPAGCP